MNSKETLEFITKLINFTKEQINYFKNKIVEDGQYPSLQKCHKEELIAAQEGLTHLQQIKQNLDRLEKLEKVIEILKNKQVHIVILLECIKANGGVELYNACIEKPYQLTQKEYDLLKKVLGNG